MVGHWTHGSSASGALRRIRVAAEPLRRGRIVSWKNPTDADWAHTIVRYLVGTQTPGSPNGSVAGYGGPGTSATLPVAHTQPVTVAVYAVDRAGNVSPVQTLTLPAS